MLLFYFVFSEVTSKGKIAITCLMRQLRVGYSCDRYCSVTKICTFPFVFIYNSFSSTIMNSFLNNIEKSFEKNKRNIYIIYYNPSGNEQQIYPIDYKYIKLYEKRWFYDANIYII